MNSKNFRLGFYLWLCQFFLAFACAFFDWHHLSLWDSMWYRHIVDNGYSNTVSPPPYQGVGNIGFFPGYPLLGWVCKTVFQVGTDAGLLIASSVASFFTWSYLAELMDMHQDPRKISNLIWIWIYPFSFFFIAAYSDSLGAATILGYFLFSEKWLQSLTADPQPEGSKRQIPSWVWFALAAVHGFGMSFTRILAMVLAIYPVLRALQLNSGWLTRFKSALLAGVAVFGAISFLIYCQIKFGAWNIYFVSEKLIWGTEVQWDKLLPPWGLFNFSRPTRGDTTGKYVTILFGLYFCYLAYDIVRQQRFRERIAALFLVGGMFWGAYLCGRSSWEFSGMGRYLIPLILLFISDFKFPEIRSLSELSVSRRVAWGLLILVLFILQVVYAAKFARNGWVA